MKAPSNILVLDVGTTGVKGMVFDARLRLLGKSYRRIKKHVIRSGWVEQDPREFVRASESVLRAAVRTSGVAPGSLARMAITNQRETTVLWNKRTGVPLYPAIVWEDTRTAPQCRALQRHAAAVRQRTGLPIDPYFSATKIAWILKHAPAASRAVESGELLFGTVDTWLMWNLLQGRPHITDYTNASRTSLFNVRTLIWDTRLLDIFGVPRALMPRVVPSAARFGTLRNDIVGTAVPVVAVCGDQQASLYAAGRRKRTTKATYGTGAFVAQIVGPRFIRKTPFFTTLAAYPKQPFYVLEAKVDDCGRAVERALKNPDTMRAVTTRIAQRVAVYLKKLPITPASVVMDGGVTQYEEMMHIQARAAGLSTRRQKIYDGTALGAAMLARLTSLQRNGRGKRDVHAYERNRVK